ncbi:MAG TPA: HAMP domain-containing sensor histidine kinase [Actinomycetota bacterium]|nr:HAMP domain-containing sensor histidine kinase [Actinomycetota bacterium]
MRKLLGIVAVAGLTLALLLALGFEMTVGDALKLGAVATGASVLTGLAGAYILWLARRRSLGAQVAIVTLIAVGAVAVGAVVTADQMFLSDHDLHSLFVVLAASGTVGIVVALILGERVARSGRSLGEATRLIAEGEVLTEVPEVSSGEFQELAMRLEETSRRLDQARRRERALDRSRRELIAWVSHDLRTPLAGIRAMAEALEDGVAGDQETIGRYHRAMRIEVDRLSGLVDDLFELSRIDAGTLHLEMQRASLGDIVSDALSAAAASARARGVRLEGRLMSEAPELELSVPEVARVLRNLLENAIRHTPSDGTVSIEAGVDDGFAFVAVQDSCGGIPEADMSKVFDVAFRGETSRTPDDGRAGLGLAIARGLVRAHNGEIRVVNQQAGCRFTVRLPITHAGSTP